MTLTRCFDAAYPPVFVPAGAGAVLGYIGSDSQDPARLDRDYHIWTPREWAPFARIRQFPAWVCNTSVAPAASAANAVSEMRELGWFPGRALVGDMEAWIDPGWWRAFEVEVEALGMVPVAYESESVIGRNGAKHVWAALWDGRPVLNDASWWAKQYVSSGGIDWSVLSSVLLEHGGLGLRNQNA